MKKLIVGVDDSMINRVLMEEVAKILDTDVITSEDGAKAFDAIVKSVEEGRVPDIIITDIHMPNVSGLDLIKKLKADSRTKYIPIFALTTETDFKKKQLGKDLGASGWLQKPLSPTEVANVIKMFLRL